MKQTPARIIAVRVDADASIVAVIDARAHVVERAQRVSGGLRAVDDRIVELVASEVPDGVPEPTSASDRAAVVRLRNGVATARMRLVDEDSTSLPVRFPGRMTFVTLERDAVAAAVHAEIAAIVAAAQELGAGPRTRIVALAGAAAVPGLLRALPGRTDASIGAGEYEALLDAAAESAVDVPDGPTVDAGATRDTASVEPETAEPETAEPETAEKAPAEKAPAEPAPADRAPAGSGPAPAPPEPPEERPVIVLRPLWPTVAAVVVILGLGGAAAAIDIGAPPAVRLDPGGPISTVTTDPHPDDVTPAPVTTPPPTVAPPGSESGGAPTVKKPKAPATGTAPGSGSPSVTSPGTGSGAPILTDPDPGPAPTDPPTDPPSDPSPVPTPTDPGDPGDGSILGIPIPPILPPLPTLP